MTGWLDFLAERKNTVSCVFEQRVWKWRLIGDKYSDIQLCQFLVISLQWLNISRDRLYLGTQQTTYPWPS